MSLQGEIDLNDLIMKDRKQAKNKRTHQIQKKRQQQQQRSKRRFEQNRQRFQQHQQHRQRSRNQGRKQSHHNHQREQRPRKNRVQQPQFQNQVYALLVHGFVSDVSVDDICNLTQDRKIISIKTQLRRKDKKPIDPKQDTQMQVTIIFAEKQQANSFIKQYNEKVLDGKHSLSFTFVVPTID